jgi:hypothetical protein
MVLSAILRTLSFCLLRVNAGLHWIPAQMDRTEFAGSREYHHLKHVDFKAVAAHCRRHRRPQAGQPPNYLVCSAR